VGQQNQWQGMGFVRSIAMMVLVSGAVGLGPVESVAQETPGGPVTYAKDIAPILQRSCGTCHNPTGIAPMPLTTYEEVRPWARAIKLKTSRREMPPWFIEKHIGIQKFKNDPSLSDAEIRLIGQWADAGAPAGNPADMPARRNYGDAATWSIGTPDLIVSSGVVTVKAVAPDWQGNIDPVPTGLLEDRYIQAVEVKEVRLGDKMQREPGRASGDLNYFVVHHAGITAFKGAREEGVEEGSENQGQFRYVYEVGQNALTWPATAGTVLEAGSRLNFNLHLHSIGREVPVRIDVAFKFYPKDYQPKYLISGFEVMGGVMDLDIPANQDDVRFDGFYTMPKHGMLLTYEPHMHMSGKRMCVEVMYPNGLRETLNCAGYNHNWVKMYFYEDDVAPVLPKGTVVHVTGWYDNTRNNPRNIEPRNWKGYGNRSIDDMFFFLPKVAFLSDEQFEELVTARKKAKTPLFLAGAAK
jgi:hypothetical protein